MSAWLRSTPQWVLVYGCVLFLLLGYSFQLSLYAPSWSSTDGGAYGELAQAFLHGHVDLLIDPDPSVTKITDPDNLYIPEKRPPDLHFLWDYSYFKKAGETSGRYYLYFGPVPALLFYCPFLVFGYMPNNLSVFLWISSLNLLTFAAILRTLVKRYFPQVPAVWEGILLLTYGLSKIEPSGQDGPTFYHIAIGCGVWMCLLTILFILLALNAQIVWLLLAGLSAGLAMGSRYNDVTMLLPIAAIWVYLVYKSHFRMKNAVLSGFALLCGPALCASGLLWYNEARFDNPFETGLRYQLNGVNHISHQFFAISYIPEGIWDYYLEPFLLSNHFPYLIFWNYIPSLDDLVRERHGYTGIFISFPICLIGLAWPIYAWQMERDELRKPCIIWGIFVSLWSVVITLMLTAFVGVTFRYEAELQMPLLLLFSLAVLSRREVLGPLRIWELAVLAVVIIHSCIMGQIYSFVGVELEVSPVTYHAR